MATNLSKIIKIKQQDYSTLMNDGEVEINGETYEYDSSALYIIVDPAVPEYAETAGYANRSGMASMDADGHTFAEYYSSKPYVATCDNDQGFLHGENYDAIKDAIDDDREVIIVYQDVLGDGSVYRLHLTNDFRSANYGYFRFSTILDDGLMIGIMLEDDDSFSTFDGRISFSDHTHPYAGSATVGGTANKTASIPYGVVDSTSTSTAYTATVPGITELVDGTIMLLKNSVVTSAAGFTININGLGAKPSYNNMATGNPTTPTNPTQDTTIFNINYTMLFIYDSTLVSGGCWICYRGYDNNTNTIGYQVRTNSSTLKAKSKFYRYRLLFTSADHQYWIPANTSSSTNATSSRTVNQDKIDPFGPITYYGTTTAIEANANVTAAQLWQQYTLTLGYSFNRTGAALTLSYPKNVYVKCTPQTDGSAIIDPDNPIAQALPSTEDGKIYILLGRAYSAIAIELLLDHPVYYYKDGAVRHWTQDSVELASLKSRVAALEAIVNPT